MFLENTSKPTNFTYINDLKIDSYINTAMFPIKLTWAWQLEVVRTDEFSN